MNEPKGQTNSKFILRTVHDSNEVNSFISDLGNKNKDIRRKAYESLMTIGEPAVAPLVESLASPNEQIRWESSKLLDEIKVDWTTHANTKTINALIADLTSENGFERTRARQALVRIGSKSVEALIQALSNPGRLMRWEAAKALSKIGDPSATDALIKALIDKDFDIRWLAAEGLIFIGEPSLVPLLRELIKNPESERLRVGAHHYLHEINNEKLTKILKPLIRALEEIEAHLVVPLAAQTALNSLTKV